MKLNNKTDIHLTSISSHTDVKEHKGAANKGKLITGFQLRVKDTLHILLTLTLPLSKTKIFVLTSFF